MIAVNGTEYRTLQQRIEVDGKRVLRAFANGQLVYPEREDTMVMKVLGSVNRLVSHSHGGEDPSCRSNDGTNYTYEDGGIYRAKAAFSMVIRNHSYRREGASSYLQYTNFS